MRWVVASKFVLCVAVVGLAGCTRKPSALAGGSADASAKAGGAALQDAAAAPEPSGVPGVSGTAGISGEDALWAAAATEDAAALVRLASRLGAAGLREAANATPSRLDTAVRAAGFAEGLAATEWLAEQVAQHEEQRDAALAALHQLAARKRSQRDPEDADELRAACALLLAFAKGTEGRAEARARSVAILRMLADYGGIVPAQIPTSMDGK